MRTVFNNLNFDYKITDGQNPELVLSIKNIFDKKEKEDEYNIERKRKIDLHKEEIRHNKKEFNKVNKKLKSYMLATPEFDTKIINISQETKTKTKT